MKNLRIALIAPQPFVEARGTPMANLRLVQALADAGYQVDVITFPFGSDPKHPGVNVSRCPDAPFVHSVGIGFSAAKALLDINLFFHALRLIRKKSFDCIHGVEEGVIIAGILGRLARKPFVYDMDSVLSHEIMGSRLRRLSRFIGAMEKWAIRNSILVMTISDSMAEYARKIAPSKDIVVVPDIPITPPSEGPSPDRARSQMPAERILGKKLIVYTGSLAGYQGLDLLISAMARVASIAPEAVLVIIGGDEKGIKRLMQMAEITGVIDNLMFLGKKPPDQVPDFLSAADMLVSPRRGGINPPAKIYTYMQSGKPIVATDIPAHTTVLGRDGAVLVNATSDGIAEGILWTLSYPEDANRKASRASEIIRGYTPELQASRIRKAYEIVGGKIDMNQAKPRVVSE